MYARNCLICPPMSFERDGFVAALVIAVRQFVLAVIVEHNGAGDRGSADHVGIYPQRNAVEPRPILICELPGCHQVFPLLVAAGSCHIRG